MAPAEEAAAQEEKADEAAEDAAAGEAAAPDAAMEPAAAAEDAATEPAKEAGEPTEPAEGEPTEPAIGEPTEPAVTEGPGGAADDDEEASRMSFPTTAHQKTVPGDRGESVAPTIPPGDRGESMPPDTDYEPGVKPKDRKTGGLTTEALALHTAALAKAQAEAYAATFAQARSHYTRSVAGRSVAGKSITGKSIAGKSIAGKSIAGRSVAGRSIAASGIVPSERTFRTHMTTRELVVGSSVMRELMRSVSPISEPGVPIKRKRAARDPSAMSGSPERPRKRKERKDKAGKRGKAKLAPRISPSHYAHLSPTPFRGRGEPSATPDDRNPSHFQTHMEPSASEDAVRARAARPKKAARGRDASPISPAGAPRKKKRGAEKKAKEGRRKNSPSPKRKRK